MHRSSSSHTVRRRAGASQVEFVLVVVLVAIPAITVVTMFGRKLAATARDATHGLDAGAPVVGGTGGAGGEGAEAFSGAGSGGSAASGGASGGASGATGPALAIGVRSPYAAALLPLPAPEGRGGAGGGGSPGGAGGPGGPGGGAGGGAAGGAGGGVADATPPRPAETPTAIMNRVALRRARQNSLSELNRARATRGERIPPEDQVSMADRAWHGRTGEEIRATDAYRRLPQAQREAFDRVWNALGPYEHDLGNVTLLAATNLARVLEEGKLEGEQGLRFLRVLQDLVDRDDHGPAGNSRPYTSDMIVLLAKDARVSNLYRDGALPVNPSREQVIATALGVTRTVHGEVISDNNWTRFSTYFWIYAAPVNVNKVREMTGGNSWETEVSPGSRRNIAVFADRVAIISRDMGYGNCMEHSAASAVALHNRGVNGVEIMVREGDPNSNTAGRHAFVVVGRNPFSNPSDPSTWGENAVIVDSWAGANEAYPASEWASRLPGRGNISTRVRLPDPVGAPGLP